MISKLKLLSAIMLMATAAWLAPCANAAQFDPEFIFRTIETEHFSIHFHQGLDEIAAKAAFFAERAHAKITKELGWEPEEKTQLVLIDDSDFANGDATVVPYNIINIHTVPPALDLTIGEYYDWLDMVITHEYTHIVAMDSARGYSKVTRRVFGKPIPGYDPASFLAFIATAPPNVLMPGWWNEGLATWSETLNTPGGRGRSTFYEMIFRMAVYENAVPGVDRINGEVPYWPDGNLRYLFGLRLQKYIADRFGDDAPGKLSITHAGRFPYFLNGAPAGLFGGRNYVTLYGEMAAELRTAENERIKELEKTPLTPLTPLALEGERLTNPRYSPDGKSIAYNRADPHDHEAIWISSADGSKTKIAARRLPSDHAITWSPDGEKIYFSQAELVRSSDVYQDLYSYDIKSGKLKRLTREKRLKEADAAPKGRRFAAVSSDRGAQNLVLLEQDPDAVSGFRFTALTDYALERLSSPRWSPDGGLIAYAATDNKGTTALRLFDLRTKTVTELLSAQGVIAYPVWSKDGGFIYYTADDTGVFNIHAYSLAEKKSYQVTHLLGGAFAGDVSPDGATLALSSYGSKGFSIATVGLDRNKWMSTPSPSIKPYWKEAPGPVDRGDAGKPGPSMEAVPASAKPYSALPTLAPRFWLPTLYGDHRGAVAGAFTAGYDALSYHTYMLEASTGLNSRELYYNALYLNDVFAPTLLFKATAKPVLYARLLGDGDYYELNRSYTAAAYFPFFFIESEYLFFAGYTWQKEEALSNLTANRFNGIDVFRGRRDYVYAGIKFTDTLRYPYSVSQEEGASLNAEYRNYSTEIGSNVNASEYRADYSQYFLMPFGGSMRHNVVFMELKGAASSGARTAQQAFQLGGTSAQNDFPLRGYPSRSLAGKYAATATLEYRAPLWYIFRGVNTKPVFLDRLHGAIFTDIGEVWRDNSDLTMDRIKVGAGVEARLDMELGYKVGVTPAIGIARGFNKDGETAVYFTIYTSL